MDFKDLPLSGVTLIAVLGYAGVSLAITGPLIVDRTVQKSGWIAQCQQGLFDEFSSVQEAPAFIPSLDCSSIFGLFGREGQKFCQQCGNVKLPFVDQLNDHKQKIQNQNEARLGAAAKMSAYRCDCALSTTLETRKIPFALYAGSARLITPMAIKNLSSELQTSLHSPLCAGKPLEGSS